MRICKWEQLPDARDPNAPDGAKCDVYLYEECLADIVSKHIARQDGPWADWLGRKLCADLSAWLDGELELTPEIQTDLCQRWREQVQESLSRPLVLLQTISGKHSVWNLVLPCGALAILKSDTQRVVMVMVRFPRRSKLSPPHRRWIRTAQDLVWSCCEVKNQGGTHQLVLAQESWLRWVRLDTWGFVAIGDRIVWRGRMGHWPAAERVSPPSRHDRIRLRRRQWIDADDAINLEDDS